MLRGMVTICMTVTALISGCDLPRDPETTMAQIRDRGTIRLGIVAGASLSGPAQLQLSRQAKNLGARVSTERDEAEALFTRLEEGELDLVYGNLSAGSPWSARVHLGTVPGRDEQPATDTAAPRFAFRNGENGWIMAMERARP